MFATAASISGAIFGGLIVYFWGRVDIAGARAVFDLLPAIAPSTIARAAQEVAGDGYGLAMLKGSMTGVPFKLYASEAGAIGLSPVIFVLLTPLVRAPRFLIAATGAALANRYAPAVLLRHKFKIIALFWLVFYALYWTFAPH